MSHTGFAIVRTFQNIVQWMFLSWPVLLRVTGILSSCHMITSYMQTDFHELTSERSWSVPSTSSQVIDSVRFWLLTVSTENLASLSLSDCFTSAWSMTNLPWKLPPFPRWK
jgi:hypothetical protein